MYQQQAMWNGFYRQGPVRGDSRFQLAYYHVTKMKGPMQNDKKQLEGVKKYIELGFYLSVKGAR